MRSELGFGVAPPSVQPEFRRSAQVQGTQQYACAWKLPGRLRHFAFRAWKLRRGNRTQKQTHQVDRLVVAHEHLSFMRKPAAFFGCKLVGTEEGEQFGVESLGAPALFVDGRAHDSAVEGRYLHDIERPREGTAYCDADHVADLAWPVRRQVFNEMQQGRHHRCIAIQQEAHRPA